VGESEIEVVESARSKSAREGGEGDMAKNEKRAVVARFG
jgi:hypothetical protein